VRQRVPIFTVKELMGHKDSSMTVRYAHLAAEAQREEIKEIEKLAKVVQKAKVVEFKPKAEG